MPSYFLKRLGMLLPTLLLVTIAVFSIIRMVPGDPVLIMMGDIDNPELVEQIREELGFNKPIIIQYMDWVKRLLKLDFGTSIVTGDPVFNTMLEHFGVTAQVVLVSILVTTCLAILGGVFAAWKQNSRTDLVLVVFAVTCMSIPSFWLGMLLIIVFGINLQWLPTVGYVSPLDDLSEGIYFLILPVLTLVITELGGILRMVRSTSIDVLRLDYIAHARSKGLGEMTVLFRHALPNTLIPTVTLIGLVLGSLLGGAAVIETVFTLPGLGRLLITSIYARDYVMVQGIMVLVSSTYVLMNLLVDLMYPVIDPRVRLH